MTLRAPLALTYYSQSDEQTFRSELEREDLNNAKLHSDAVFNTVDIENIAVNGTAQFNVASFAVTGDINASNLILSGTVSTSGFLIPASFTIQGTGVSRAAWIAAISTNVPARFAWLGPTTGTGVPSFRAITAADLPDYTEIAVPDSTVTTVASNAAANVPLSTALGIAANDIAVGDTIRGTFRGVFGTAGVLPTLTLAVLNNTQLLCTTGSNNAPAASLVNRGWEVVVDIIVTALGGLTGRCEAQGRARFSTSATADTGWDMENAAVVNLNTASAMSIQLCVTWGTAAAANTISCRQSIWEVIKA